ncbi:MAG: gamma-glutamyl-gamma-aminobutyrate hydrolase family protein [Actinobacteria bacterium]|nr:gamma-glutamyl-gamma-aminobutyrate hydrolase family protein [Actinomycetota bacterium]
MNKVLVIQHIGCEPLGLFALDTEGLAEFIYARPFEGEPVPHSLEGWDNLIILGGPMAVYEPEVNPYLEEELGLIRQAIREDFPMLGICLGSQLIAAASGAAVYPGSRREAGWGEVVLSEAARDDALFAGLSSPMPVFQLHGDTFDLPDGAVRLAANDLYANQAFRMGENIYGLQFHVEVTASLVEEWAVFYRDYIAGAGVSPGSLLEELVPRSESLRPISSQIITGFLGRSRTS